MVHLAAERPRSTWRCALDNRHPREPGFSLSVLFRQQPKIRSDSTLRIRSSNPVGLICRPFGSSLGVKYSLIILGVFLGFMIIFNVVGMMVVVGRENWLFAGLNTAVVGLSLFYYLRLRLDSGGTNGAHSQLGAWRRCVLL